MELLRCSAALCRCIGVAVVFAAAAGSSSGSVNPATNAVRMPLEWRVGFPADAPYEVEIDSGRLVELGVVSKPASAFAVEAQVDGRIVRLPAKALKGRTSDHLRIRFSPPAGTTSLTLLGDVPERLKIEDSARCDNMLARALDEANIGGWTCDPKVKAKITRTGEGVLLDGGRRGVGVFDTSGASFTADIPGDAAGKPVLFELDVRSLAPETWPNHIRVRQLDADGRELAESVVDPRWLSHMRPSGKKCSFREGGRLHPAARKVKLCFGLRWDVFKFGSDGKPAAPDRFRPQLLVSHVAMRVARGIPFPGMEKGMFSKGVSGEPGDEALNIGTNRVFFYQTRSQASWAEGIPLRDERDCFYPFAAGTVEAWFRPEFGKPKVPYALFDAAHYVARAEGGPKWPVNRGSLLLVTYHPGTQRLELSMKDRADKVFRAEADVSIPDGEWSHVAVSFDPGSEARVYVNGRRALACPLKGFVRYDPATAQVPNDDGPVEVYAGSFHRTIQTSFARLKHPSLNGAIDLLRVSSGVRYAGDFKPPRSFAADGDTRALFLFDRSFDGVSGGGIGFIPGSAWSMTPRTSRTLSANGRTYPYFPEEVPSWNDPYKVFGNLNYPTVPSDEDLRLAWRPRRLEFYVKAGERRSVTAPKGVVTDSIEIRNTGDEPLVLPVLLNNGEADARSYADLAATLCRPGLSDRMLSDRIFDFMLRSSDYFMHHVPTFNPGSDRPRSVEYDALFMLNGYCGFECGPLNNLVANVFAHSGRLPAVRTGGYGHEFEGVFFDSMNHIYDLSARKFFPAYDNVTAAGLREADAEPGLLTRYGGRHYAFTRKSNRYHVVQRSHFQKKVGPVLNPGERFVASFANDGHVNILQLNPCFTGGRKTLNRPLRQYKWECVDEVHAKLRKGQELCRVERWFPDYGNAFVVFDGPPAAGNPAFTNITEKSFSYSVRSAYPIVWADYRAELDGGGTAPLEISTDLGKTWRRLEVPAELPVMGRVAYLVRVMAPMGRVARFRAVTESQFNPRVYPGRLRAGGNTLEFRADSGKGAHLAIRYREPAGRISVAGSVAWGAIPGFGKRLVTLDPSTPARFAVKGLDSAATVRTHGPVSARLSGGGLAIEAAQGGKFPAFATVTLCDGDSSQDLLVLVASGVRLALPTAPVMLKERSDLARFTYPKLPAGRYVILQLERFKALRNVSRIGSPKLAIRVPGRKSSETAGGLMRLATDFWNCTMGTPGEGRRANWKWDFATDPDSVYPYELMREWDMPESGKVEYFLRQPQDGGVELAGVLILPAPEAPFRAELIKMLTGFRTMPPGTVSP